MKLVPLLVVMTMVLVCACTTKPIPDAGSSPMSSPEACAASDGEWIPYSDLFPGEELDAYNARRYICNLRTRDGGRVCTDNRQCKGYCVPPVGAESGEQVTGECSDSIQRVARALSVIDGRVTYPDFSLAMTEQKADMLQRLGAARQRWSSHGIRDYEITLAQNCYCLYGPYYGPNRVIVRDGRIVRVVYQGEPRDGFRSGDSLTRERALKYTVEDIFDDLESTIGRMTANAVLNVEYDPDYGFPTLVYFDRPDVADEQSRLVVTNFRSSDP